MIYGLFVILGIGCAIVVIIAVCAIRTALTAEENLQAFLHAHRATVEFIQRSEGQWPQSWDDLRGVSPESDFEWVAAHVTFDFNADRDELIAQTPDMFTAIVPHEPCYVVDYEIQWLIDDLKKYHEPKQIVTEQVHATE